MSDGEFITARANERSRHNAEPTRQPGARPRRSKGESQVESATLACAKAAGLLYDLPDIGATIHRMRYGAWSAVEL
ncbi:hypothetical protein [Streptomyces goshikiensis]|uniref:hypothetical protein n=1 Tax=Streptomyces goshikiensis TaxID=1942 RepID=UPI0036490491